MERLISYDDGLTGRYHKARYELAREYCKGKNVIDVACGSGEGTRILCAVAESVRGIDPFIQPGDLESSMINGYIETLSESSCDAIVCLETIEHTISIELSVRMLASALTKDGVLILSFPNGWGETEYHLHDTGIELIPALERCFEIREIYGQSRKTYINPVKIEMESAERYENILVIATRKPDLPATLSYEERFALIYSECLRRQKDKTKTTGFRCKVLPARIRTKWKRMFGVR